MLPPRAVYLLSYSSVQGNPTEELDQFSREHDKQWDSHTSLRLCDSTLRMVFCRKVLLSSVMRLSPAPAFSKPVGLCFNCEESKETNKRIHKSHPTSKTGCVKYTVLYESTQGVPSKRVHPALPSPLQLLWTCHTLRSCLPYHHCRHDCELK